MYSKIEKHLYTKSWGYLLLGKEEGGVGLGEEHVACQLQSTILFPKKLRGMVGGMRQAWE